MDLLTVTIAKDQLQKKVASKLLQLQGHLILKPGNLEGQIALIQNIRSDVYEALNQLQHEYLIIKAATEFEKKFPQIDKWCWHPNQTGGLTEADLMGYEKNKIVLSAEITTSQRPDGIIDTRMRRTLVKLSKLQGDKFYIVQSESMKRRAATKIRKLHLDIAVLYIEQIEAPIK